VSDGTIYLTNFAPSTDNSAIALDAQDGSERWRTNLTGSEFPDFHQSVVIEDLFVVALDSELVALDSESGEERWTQPIPRFPGATVADEATGTVLNCRRELIQAFDTDGEKRWETTSVSGATPAVFDDTIFVLGTIDNSAALAALSMDDGTVRWTTEIESPPESTDPVATPQGVVLIDDRTLVVHDRDTGDRIREIHSLDDGSEIVPQSVAADGGTVFVTSPATIGAYDIETGTEQWSLDERVGNDGLCIGNETVVVPVDDPSYSPDNSSKTISVLERSSGEMRWFYAFDAQHSPLTSPPVLTDGAVFFTGNSFDGIGALGAV
jgi:outer membrane protein assembly factor BamB